MERVDYSCPIAKLMRLILKEARDKGARELRFVFENACVGEGADPTGSIVILDEKGRRLLAPPAKHFPDLQSWFFFTSLNEPDCGFSLSFAEGCLLKVNMAPGPGDAAAGADANGQGRSSAS